MKRFYCLLPTALSASIALSFLGTAHAETYEFRQVVTGLQGGSNLDVSWEAFAEKHNLPVDTTWNDLSWAGQGLGALPTRPYPNPNPTGEIHIEGNGLTSLGGLSALQTVRRIYAQHNDLSNLDELSSLNSVQYSIDFRDNNLTNIDGIDGITGSSVSVLFMNNDLQNVGALSAITTLGVVDVRGNPNLNDLSGFNGASSLGSYAYFDSNISSRPGFVNLQSYSGICKAYDWQIRNVTTSQICN